MSRPDGGMGRLDASKLDRRILAGEAPQTPEDRIEQYHRALMAWKLDLYLKTGDVGDLLAATELIIDYHIDRRTTC